jgi:ABC-type sulfate transport system substrate-binding protein
VEGVPGDDEAAAQQFMLSVLRNVTVMDKAARESITNLKKVLVIWLLRTKTKSWLGR